VSSRLLFAAWLVLALLWGACEPPPATEPHPRVAVEPTPELPEDPPYAPDSVFRPETHRPDPVPPTGALKARETIRAQDARPFSYFGQAAALDGDFAVIGAPYDDGAGPDAGAAYVFRRRGERWVQAAKLTAPAPRAFDRFGFSVAVSGGTVVVGADRRDERGHEGSGAAFVYRAAGEGWSLEAALRPHDPAASDGLGISVAADGDAILVGAPGKDETLPGAGAAYLFRRAHGRWREEAKLSDPSPTERGGFGHAVALRGDVALVGAPTSSDLEVMGGRAYLYRRGARGWKLEARLAPRAPKPLQKFGAAVALSRDGALVGAPRATLGEKTRAGAVSLFRPTEQGWELAAELTGSPPRSDEEFGRTVSLAAERLLVGSQFGDAAGLNTGVAWLFDRRGDRWQSRGPVLAPDAAALDEFGTAAVLSERWILIGAPRETGAGNAAGAAYLYDLSGGE
jgi:hypothetical protein